jgi:hypothetical protein
MTTMLALSTLTWYLSIDCGFDIHNDTLEISTDKSVFAVGGLGGVAATYLPAPAPRLVNKKPGPPEGFSRYWWKIVLGPSQATVLRPASGSSLIYGRLTDNPDVPVFTWRIYLPN